MSSPPHAPVGESETDRLTVASPSSTPRLGEMDLGRQSFFAGNSRSSTPAFDGTSSPGFGESRGLFSSAQAYAPVDNGNHTPRPGTPGSPGFEGMMRSASGTPWSPGPGFQPQYSLPSHRGSIASSHMLGSIADYSSQHFLMPNANSGSIPMQSYGSDDGGSGAVTSEKAPDEKYGRRPLPTRKKWCIFAAVVAALIVIAIAVAVPLVVIHDNNASGGGAKGSDGKNLATSGGNGSVITMENGTQFTYLNDFGGYWRSGLADNSAKAQSYTPALNESWDYAKNRMLGVNLGGWLVIEPFIVPGLFEPYENNSNTYVVDEYTLMQQWTKESGADGARQRLINHYDTFVTEQDFAEIAAAGLNWIRLPIGYWAVSTEAGEPFLQGVSWSYFLKAIKWARKYGLRINLDLHNVPGSQNGYNHGGRLGVFNFLNSPSGLVSGQRALQIIATISEFLAQPDISNVVPVFGILNEPNIPMGIGMDSVRRFYSEVYNIVRNASQTGAGHGPFISYHDGFMGLSSWSGFMQGGDRVAWDLHPYVCFVPPFGDRKQLIASACNGFQANTDQGLQQFGVTMAGEWSLAPNDCGLFLNGPFQGVRYDGTFSSGDFKKQGDCEPFDDWLSYSNATKQDMLNGAIAQMQSFRNFFFWTWKIGGSVRLAGLPPNPNWNYKLGLEQGWMPKDPNSQMKNACAKLQQEGVSGISKTSLDWQTAFADYQTGSAASYAPATSTYAWPPTSLYSSGTTNALGASTLPSYTATGSPQLPPTPTYSVSMSKEPTPSINPWVAAPTNAYVPVQGCQYFGSIWENASSVQEGWPCTGNNGNSRRMLRFGYPFAQVDGGENFADLQVDVSHPPSLKVARGDPLGPKPTPMPEMRR